jgi:MFS family permease
MPKNRILLAFSIPGYGWLWLSTLTNSSIISVYNLSQGWLLLRMTDSPLMVGFGAGFFGGGSLLSSLFSGVLADRVDRRSIVMAGQSSLSGAVLLLAVLAVTDLIQVWHVFTVAGVIGLLWGCQAPARSTLQFDLVGRERLVNAIATQFMAHHLSSVLGPLSAGFVLEYYGAGPLFFIVSGWLALGALSLLKVPRPEHIAPARGSVIENLLAGFSYIWHDKRSRTVFSVILITEGLGFSSVSMLPVVVEDNLHAGAVVLGLLATFRGIGGMTAALIVSRFADVKEKGWVFVCASFGFGACLVLFSLSREVSISLALLVAVGACGVIYDTFGVTLLQSLSPEAMRGRVMGVYSSILSGINLGGFGMGSVAGALGVTWAIAGGGGLVALHALIRMPMASFLGRPREVEEAVDTRGRPATAGAKE